MRNEESSASSVSKSGKRHVKPVDPDPNGEKLLQVTSISYCFFPPQILFLIASRPLRLQSTHLSSQMNSS